MPLNVQKIREDFPNLHTRIRGRPLVYLDNAATTFKPFTVIQAIEAYYRQGTSNIHRGVHYLSEKATAAYESAREKIKIFLNAKSSEEIIFTRGTTEAINLVAHSFAKQYCKAGDEIIISAMEHHSNIVPWQIVCQERGCHLRVIPINEKGELILSEFDKLLSEKTRLVAIVYASNSLGTINPVKEIIAKAHVYRIPVLLDAAQAVDHLSMDVQALDCDFLAFSGHKIYGPTGIGILYGKANWLDSLPPYQGGGDMIASVTFAKTTYNHLPYKFEAGTPHVAGGIGLGAAVDYVRSLGCEDIAAYKKELLAYATATLQRVDDLRIIGTAQHKTSIISFILPHIHAHDLGTLVDEEGVAIRTGHHCTMPVMQYFGVAATSRASLTFYNTKEEIDILAAAIEKAKAVFA
jgi:cysteine desulfurase/selenocysteine lyase